ncbi:MAG: sigma-70 family RNA polymerase sigma factor [Anaerolineae bacterium]
MDEDERSQRTHGGVMSISSLHIGSYPERRLLLRRVCREAVDSLVTRDGYRFLDRKSFTEVVFNEANDNREIAERLVKVTQYALPEKELAAAVTRLAKGIYSEQLYAGCRNPNRATRERAYREIEAYCASLIFTTKVRRSDMYHVDNGTFLHDCLQDALANISRSIDNVDQPRGFLRYIQKVAKTSFGHWCEKWHRDTEHTVEPPDPDDDRTERIELVDALAEEIFEELLTYLAQPAIIRCLLAALDRLGPEYRWACILVAFRGNSPEEIVRILGMTKGNLATMLHRARKALRQDHEFRQCAER